MRFFIIIAVFIHVVYANEHLQSLYSNILLADAKEAVGAAKKLEKTIAHNDPGQMRHDFTALVTRWKSVQTFYILGELDGSYLDTPRYIDIFHHGNEDIAQQLKRVVRSDGDVQTALFKHSYKSINALEYILFAHDPSKARVNAIATVIIQSIQGYLRDIVQGYEQNSRRFVSDEKRANAMVLNTLSQSSYKLKEWRIGDPAGLSRKYENDPDNGRAEYYRSQTSKQAIAAIVDTHLRVLGPGPHKNYGSLLTSYGADKELAQTLQYLRRIRNNLHLIEGDDFGNARRLYDLAQKLHTAYYVTLIAELKVTSKVLDADGD